jgi:hypothetical protein
MKPVLQDLDFLARRDDSWWDRRFACHRRLYLALVVQLFKLQRRFHRRAAQPQEAGWKPACRMQSCPTPAHGDQ